MTQDRPVKLWLDKDQEGSVKKKALRLGSIIGRSVDVIVTEKDPKSYTLKQLGEIINGI